MEKPFIFIHNFFTSHRRVLFTLFIVFFWGTGFFASKYWVNVTYSKTHDLKPPMVLVNSPATGLTNIGISPSVTAIFSEQINPETLTDANFVLKDHLDHVIPAKLSYSKSTRTATLIPKQLLDYSTTYTAMVKGGATGIRDQSGNNLQSDFTWNLKTTLPPDKGTGGPVLVISSSLSPFSKYMAEILRAQGYNSFRAVDITQINPLMLDSFDVILLGNIAVVASEAAMLSNWAKAGGTLIAQRPGPLLLPLMGLVKTGTEPDNITNTYLLVDTAAGLPGAGIVSQTIQYHGVADKYIMKPGTTALATLYSSAYTATANPAITTTNVGTNGGKAIAFAFDLAKSIVLTRQGNIAWATKNRDDQSGPIRSDDLFFPNYVDFNKIQIPQADEQQHLLTNIILLSNLHRKPLPHLWLLPGDLKAAVVMTGDDHGYLFYVGSTGTAGRFNEYIKLSGTENNQQGVDDWKAIRATSYVNNNIALPDDSVAYYQSLGFEIALHPTTICNDFTMTSLSSDIKRQWNALHTHLPSMNPIASNRTHCLPWSDWSSQAKVEQALGIRFDVNYYYWPGSWVRNRPGLFTGSGMPMRFSDEDGTIIDVYQAPTQMPDESHLDIPRSINTLLDNAINRGYYGTFVMNMHMDSARHVGSDQVIAAARARHVPVITARQLLTWLDNRNNTVFSHMEWLNNRLSFDITTAARNLRAMVPANSADGELKGITENGRLINYSLQTVKGIQYGIFPAATNHYVAIYSGKSPAGTLTNFTITKQEDNARLNWSTSMNDHNRGFEIQWSTDVTNWTVLDFVAGTGKNPVINEYQYLDKNLPAGTYYYRLRKIDLEGHSIFSKIIPVTF
jgi:hypothetical protein